MGLKQILPIKNYFLFILSLIVGVSVGYASFISGESLNSFIFLMILILVGISAVRSLKLSFCLFLFVLPMSDILQINVFFPVRIEYFFFLFLFLSVLYNFDNKSDKISLINIIRSPMDFAFALFMFVIVISVFQSTYIPPNPPILLSRFVNYPWVKSISKIVLLLVCLVLFYITQYVVNSKEKLKYYLSGYSFFVCIFAFYGLCSLLLYMLSGHLISLDGQASLVDMPNDIPRIVGTEEEPVFFGFYLMTILPLLLSFLFASYFSRDKPEFYNNKLLFIITLIITAALIGTGSRSVILALIISSITILILFKEERSIIQYSKDILHNIYAGAGNLFALRTVKVIGMLFLICIGLYVGLYMDVIKTKYANEVYPNIKDNIEKLIVTPIVGTFDSSYGKFWSTRTRLITSEYAVDLFKQHPWLGVGYENYRFYSGNKVYHGLMRTTNVRWPEVNNYPLKVLAELGIIGFLLFIFLAFSFFYYLVSALRKTTDLFLKTVLRGYIACFVGISVILFFSSTITRSYLWVCIGLAVAAIKIAEPKYSSSKEKIFKI